MKQYKQLLPVLFFWAALIGGASTAQAQSGDQILDGIGETALVARYLFKGDAKDWSRNSLHATYQGSGKPFVRDDRFGNVLSLSGDSVSYLSLPAGILSDLESISLTGWLLFRSTKIGQPIVAIGKKTTHHFSATTAKAAGGTGILSAINTAKGAKKTAATKPMATNKWMHLAIVWDLPAKTLTTYIDGQLASRETGITAELADVVGEAPAGKHFFIGKSLAAGEPHLNALLHDFRIYRVPLTRHEVSGIYVNAGKGGLSQGTVNTTARQAEDDLPRFPDTKAKLYNAYLVGVTDVNVETTVGNLPRLPAYTTGTYNRKLAGRGPAVRVLWPAPTDNADVQKPGQYTVVGRVPGTAFQPKAIVTVKAAGKPVAPARILAAFPLDKVRLNNDAEGRATRFVENRDKFIGTLAQTDPNAFLYMFRHAFGQRQPDGAKPLGVWDSRDTKLRGHATGHYLTAIAQAYAGTGYDTALQANFARKMTYVVNTLSDLAQLSGKPKEGSGAHVADPRAVPQGPGKSAYDSDLSDAGIRTDYWNWGAGYISAYPPDQFIMLEYGARYGGQSNQIWAPYYTLHKILAGLLDVYAVSGNPKALAVASGMGNWVYARLSQLPTDTLVRMWNTYIAGEFGGMNEVMARLYRITRDPNHLKTAKLFDNIRVFFGDTAHVHGLAKNVDLFRGLHANQHIPQIVGSVETYRVSGNPEYFQVADNFWYKMVNDYMYSIGGVAGARNPANAECFVSQPGTLYENGFSSGGQNETCATYNMLKLTSELFQFDPRAELMDYYERALYNHILASVAENSPANTYHVPLRPGSAKQFGNPDMTGFTCCNGTAIESSTKLQSAIYFKTPDDQALYVNLFIPSTLHWTERNITVEQTTSFPREDQTRLTIHGSGQFAIYVRVPAWATQGFLVKINGASQNLQAQPGTYLQLDRSWKDGDVIEIKMPFRFRLDPVMDQPNIASLFYGPVLLAAQEPEARKDWRQITLDAQEPGRSIKGDPRQLRFAVGDAVLKPFYDTYGRHSVYLDVQLK